MTPLTHGYQLSAEEVERIISREFSPEKFVSLCNAVVWALSGKKYATLPSFTERVNVKDGGIDAEFYADETYSSPLIGSGWNVFQYKQRDIFASSRNNAFSQLRREMQGAVQEIYKRTQRRPNRYILFTNIDLTHQTKAKNAANPEKDELKNKILKNYDQPDAVKVEIVGAAELATFLNNLPHIRLSFFSTLQFATWQRAWSEHEKRKIYGANTKLIGRNEQLDELIKLIDNPDIRAIVISGAKGIGKARVALESTKHRAIETVVALDRSINPSDLLHLESPDLEVIIIIEDPETIKIEDFINQILPHSSLKLLITLPRSEKSPIINWGMDERVRNLTLSPLSQAASKELLAAAQVSFDYAMQLWIIKQAGGNPGILLLAAKYGSKLRQEFPDFIEQIAKALEQELQTQFDHTTFAVLKLLSLFNSVGIQGILSQEIELICKWFNPSIQPQKVTQIAKRLVDTGFVNIRGLYAEVVPPLFANYLAASLLQGHPAKLFALFAELSQHGRVRLVERLQELRPEKTEGFWIKLFSDSGLLKDFHTALSNKEILRSATSAVPDRVVSLVDQGIKSLTFEERKSLQDSERDILLWILEELVFRNRTSLRALCSLRLLAETETTGYSNYSLTSKFCQYFRPLHPQVPLPLQNRLELLKELTSPQSSVESRLLAVEVIKTVLYRWGYSFLHEGSGNEPLDSMPQMTWGDVWSYRETLVKHLIELAQSPVSQVSESAQQALPTAIAEFSILQFSPEITISVFKTIVDWVVNQQVSLPVYKLADALQSVYNFYGKDEHEYSENIAIKVQKFLKKITILIGKIEPNDFSEKLKRWSGTWIINHGIYVLDENGKRIYRCEQEARNLAEEVIRNPSVLTQDLLDWLGSENAKEAHWFCFWLGKLDSDRSWLTDIKTIGTKLQGINVFSAYLHGLSTINRQFVSDYLDQVTELGQIEAQAIVSATEKLGGDQAGVKRIMRLIEEQRVDPVYVESVLQWGRWFDSLSSGEYLCLLRTIAGSSLENASAVIQSFFMWNDSKKLIEGELAEFAWKCLEAKNIDHQAFYADQLALQLVKSDVVRGFTLLKNLLFKQSTNDRFWNPIDCFCQHREFGRFLYTFSRKRAITVCLQAALDDVYKPSRISGDLQGVIDQQDNSDLLIEFALQSEDHAEVICEVLSAYKDNFWEIAFKIIKKYSNSQKIRNYLSDIYLRKLDYSKSRLEHLENRLNTLNNVMGSNTKIPLTARLWLEELASDLKNKIQKKHHPEVEVVNDQESNDNC